MDLRTVVRGDLRITVSAEADDRTLKAKQVFLLDPSGRITASE